MGRHGRRRGDSPVRRDRDRDQDRRRQRTPQDSNGRHRDSGRGGGDDRDHDRFREDRDWDRRRDNRDGNRGRHAESRGSRGGLARDRRDSRDGREARDTRDTRAGRDGRDGGGRRDSFYNREGRSRDRRGRRDSFSSRDSREGRGDGRDRRDRDSRARPNVTRGERDRDHDRDRDRDRDADRQAQRGRGGRDGRADREGRGGRDAKGPKSAKDAVEQKGANIAKGDRPRGGVVEGPSAREAPVPKSRRHRSTEDNRHDSERRHKHNDHRRGDHRSRNREERKNRSHRPTRETSSSSSSSDSESSDARRKRRQEKTQYSGGEGATLFDGKYLVERKLGEGSFSRVMLCKRADVEVNAADRFAVKIVRAEECYMHTAEEELGVLKRLDEGDCFQQHCFLRILHSFLEAKEGCEARHTCIVTPCYGPSLFQLLSTNDYKGYPPKMVKSIAEQMLKCMAYVHGKGVVHTDLKPENVLFKKMETEKAASGLTLPVSSDIVVIDFGSAFDTNNKSARKRQTIGTRHYRAPEAVLYLGWSTPADVWAIGTMLVELAAGECMFQTHETREHLAMMEYVIGRFPKAMVANAATSVKKRNEPHYFDKNGNVDWPPADETKDNIKFVKDLPPLDRQCEVMHAGGTLPPRGESFHDIISDMLRYDPEDRITCRKALSHAFFDDE